MIDAAQTAPNLRVIRGGDDGGAAGGGGGAGPERAELFPVPSRNGRFYTPGVGVWKSRQEGFEAVLDWFPEVLELLAERDQDDSPTDQGRRRRTSRAGDIPRRYRPPARGGI